MHELCAFLLMFSSLFRQLDSHAASSEQNVGSCAAFDVAQVGARALPSCPFADGEIFSGESSKIHDFNLK